MGRRDARRGLRADPVARAGVGMRARVNPLRDRARPHPRGTAQRSSNVRRSGSRTDARRAAAHGRRPAPGVAGTGRSGRGRRRSTCVSWSIDLREDLRPWSCASACAMVGGEREKGVVMRAVVAYESMYGNTRRVADAIADGLRSTCSVTVVPVSRLEREALDTVDLIVIGGPTHVRGMSRASTRKAAVEAAGKPGSTLTVEAGRASYWRKGTAHLPQRTECPGCRLRHQDQDGGAAVRSGLSRYRQRAAPSRSQNAGQTGELPGDER